jgi:nucleoside-diphosphate-sugar epimerase
MFGNGENRYQLLDVRDMAKGIGLLEAADAEGVFYFGSRDFGTIQEDFQVLLNHAQSGARLQFVPGRTSRLVLRGMELANMVPLSEWYYMGARGEDSVFDIARAERELGWRPERGNAQSLTEAYDCYVESITASGTAQSTHPIPLAHRVLKKLAWFIQ